MWGSLNDSIDARHIFEEAMRLFATRKHHQNRAAVDPWTIVHFGSGLAAGLMEVPASLAAGAAVGYEVVEQVLERHEWGKELFETSGPETVANAIVDVVVFMAGYHIGRWWNTTGRRR
ncbi:MAG TPA: hypothetical protein VNZ57_14250 [Longimicrobiales bacterium]|nr:hypothetical protein [Longimicrobiales bacterium]